MSIQRDLTSRMERMCYDKEIDYSKSDSFKKQKSSPSRTSDTVNSKSDSLLDPEKRLKFARGLILLILGSILILVFAKAFFESEAMDDAFSMVIPTLLSVLGIVTAFYFDRK